jgi:autotransporter-associated beta strand protein
LQIYWDEPYTTQIERYTGYVNQTTTSLDTLQDPTAVFNLDADVTLGGSRQVFALKISDKAITIGADNAALTLGNGTGQAGLIFNGGAIQAGSGKTDTSLAFGGAEGVIYASSGGGTIGTAISGTAGLTKFGPGRLVLSGDNSGLSGSLSVNGGTLNVQSATALGSTNTTVASGAALEIQGGVGVGGTSLTLNGTGYWGALRSVSGQNAYSGAITLGSDAQVFVVCDNFTLGGSISLGGRSLVKSGLGTLVITGTNGDAGSIFVSAGTLQVGDGGATGSITGNIGIGNMAEVVFNRSDAVTYNGSISGLGHLRQAGSGTLTLGVPNSFAGDTRIVSGTLKIGCSTALQNSILDMNAADAGTFDMNHLDAVLGGLMGSRNLTIAPNRTLTVGTWISSSEPARTYSGVLSGGALATTGWRGTLTLTGANAYTGDTTISPGTTLQIGDGGTTGSITSNVIIHSGTLTFKRSNDYTFAYDISGHGSVVQFGSGTTILCGNNTYFGSTTVLRGTLRLDGATAHLPSSSYIRLGGGTLEYVGAATGSSGQLGPLFLDGEATVRSVYGGAGDTVLTFASLDGREIGGVGNFISGGRDTTNRISFVTAPGTGFCDQGLFFRSADYMAYDAAGYVRGLDYAPGNADNAVSVAAGANIGASSGKHVETTGAITAQPSIGINTLKINGPGDFTLADGATLTLANSGLLKTGGGAAAISGGSRIDCADLQLLIRADTAADLLAISTPISKAGGTFTKTGAGTLTLSGNSYLGSAYINAGRLVLAGGTTNGGFSFLVGSSGFPAPWTSPALLSTVRFCL